MSSLQEALNNAAKRLNLKKLHDGSKQKSQGDGAFENSFAQGLDISELLSTEAQPATSGKSAAKELLKIKEAERQQQRVQEEEDARMHEALQKQLNALKQKPLKKKASTKSVFEIGDALVRMHGTDEMAAVILSQKVTTRKGNCRRKPSSRRMSHKSNKSSISKKSRKLKF